MVRWTAVKPRCNWALTSQSARAQHVRIRYSELSAETCIKPLSGSKGDNYDKVTAKKINGLYKTEPALCRELWTSEEPVELASLEWVSWFVHHQLL